MSCSFIEALSARTDSLIAESFIRKIPMGLPEIRDRLRGQTTEPLSMNYNGSNQVFHLGNKSVELAGMPSDDEIIDALIKQSNLTKIDAIARTASPHMSITGYEPGSIKAKLEALKTAGKLRRDAALRKLDTAGKKHEAISAEIEMIATQIEKEADDALQEFAQFTNGGSA